MLEKLNFYDASIHCLPPANNKLEKRRKNENEKRKKREKKKGVKKKK